MSEAAIARTENAFPSQGIVHDLAGLPVECSGWVWRLNNPTANRPVISFRRLGFSAGLLEATAKFAAERIATVSAEDVYNTFEVLTLLHRSSHLQSCMRTGEVIEEPLIAELRLMPNFAHWRLHYVRSWYRWCALWKFPQFSRDVADRLDQLTFGGNEKGRAVIERDPLKGAFDQLEFMALSTKLRSSEASELLDPDELALVWLGIAFGKNAIAYALMREEDYSPLVEEGTGRILHRFSVPRAKKGADDYRTDFTRHMLNDEIGARVATLVEHNRNCRAANRWPEGCAFPLFPRSAPREDLLGGVRHEYAMHRTSEEILHMLKGAVAKLGIVSHRTGEPLNVNPRRLRRTFATRAVEEGASPAQLASMLDHTDLQNVMVYFETRSSQVERLDTALALKLGPIAKAFMGRIVGDEADAVNGGDPSKRIAGFRRQPGGPLQRTGNVGTCGSGPCDLFAPISCYTCGKFQPWKDGPHKEVLDWLCEERARKERDGLDKQVVGIHDATILAVAEVVRRCEEAMP
ncbi:MAG: hypothetical protein JWR80_6274 [Bradyrhizobium sp.]|nr:hypothetical protein [Bradyrhizobium sp.]